MKDKHYFLCGLLLLCSCANSERSEYVLTDTLLRQMQAGDRNSYSVLNADSPSSNLESYTETLKAKSLLAPDNSSANILTESFSQSGNLIFPFISRMFFYDDAGNLLLAGVTRSGQNYWLVDDDLSEFGKTLLPKDLSTLLEPINISSALKRCENQLCETFGQISVTLQPEGTETVKTSYAEFETYKLSLKWEVSIFDTENANNSIYQTLRQSGSRQWIHPAIGVVKFIYQIENDAQAATLIGQLAETNISIPSRYKK